jgi:hypothetical protein
MGGFPSWVENNWFSVIQTVGIMASLWMTAGASNREAKAREVETLLTLADQHRGLWSTLRQHPELERVLKVDADTLVLPPAVAEEEFINSVMLHFQTTWRIANAGGVITLKELATDVRGFFSLPLPHAVWEKTKKSRNQGFVKFVDRALEADGRL